MDLGELVGLMLGARPGYAAARVVVERPGQPADGYRVTVRGGTDWTIVRDRGLTHRLTPRGTTVERDGVLVESGPPKRLDGEPAVMLLMPRYALIYGRPGEDWRLTEDLEVTADTVVAPLRRTDGGDAEGRATVSRASGMLRELVLDDVTFRLAGLTTEPG